MTNDRHWHLTEIGKREMMQGKVMRAEWFSSTPEPMEMLVLEAMLAEVGRAGTEGKAPHE